MEQRQTNFAVRVIIIKDGKVLLGKNKGKFAPGKYGPPGGHIEYMESFEDCVKRELLEECGVEVDHLRFQAIINNTDDAPFHNIHIMLLADWKSGDPKVLEPEKCELWDWYDINNPPQPLFKNVQLSLESYKTGKNYFDIEK